MRKLVLFGLLGGVFGMALLLEHLFSRQEERRRATSDKVVMVLGGGPPRTIPDAPPAEPAASEDPAKQGAAAAGKTAAARERKADEPPPARTHKVKKGDTLSKLAARYLGDATRWREIQRLNDISDPTAVREGATLKLPEK
jgi:nucleoid-associated protein YgaU